MGREETVRFRCLDGSKSTFGTLTYSRLGALEQLGLPLMVFYRIGTISSMATRRQLSPSRSKR